MIWERLNSIFFIRIAKTDRLLAEKKCVRDLSELACCPCFIYVFFIAWLWFSHFNVDQVYLLKCNKFWTPENARFRSEREKYTHSIYLFVYFAIFWIERDTQLPSERMWHNAHAVHAQKTKRYTYSERSSHTEMIKRLFFTPVICILKWLAHQKLGQALFGRRFGTEFC